MNESVQQEIALRVEHMSDSERDHLSELILLLTRCFGEQADRSGAIVMAVNTGELQIMPVNSSRIEAMNLVVSTNQYLSVFDTMDKGPIQ